MMNRYLVTLICVSGIAGLFASCADSQASHAQEVSGNAGEIHFVLNQDVLREGNGPFYHLPYKDVLTKALATSPVLNEFRQRVVQASYRRDSAWSAALPHIDFSTTYKMYSPVATGALAASSGAYPSVGNSLDASIKIHQVIFDFGRIHWSTLAAELNEKAAVEDYRRALNRVILDVTLSYLQATRAQEGIDLQENVVAAKQEHVRAAEARFRTGVLPKVDLLKAQNDLALSQDRLAQAQLNLRQQSGNIYLYINERPSDKPILVDPLPLGGEPPQSEDPGLDQALYRRPEVSSLKWSIEAGKAQVNYAASGMSPSISVDAAAGQNLISNVYQPQGMQWSVMVNLNIPVFDGGLTEAQTGEAKAKVAELESTLQDAQRSVMADVDAQYALMKSLWSRLKILDETVSLSEDALRLAQARFRTGVGSHTEVVEALSAYEQTKLSFIAIQHDYRAAQAQWQWAVSADFPIDVPGPREGVPRSTLNAPAGSIVATK